MNGRTGGFGRRKFVAGSAGLLAAAKSVLSQQSLYSDGDFAGAPISGPFRPNWESLRAYRFPDWFRDAKFGIWAHWSPQCVPEQGDWYARGMYIPAPTTDAAPSGAARIPIRTSAVAPTDHGRRAQERPLASGLTRVIAPQHGQPEVSSGAPVPRAACRLRAGIPVKWRHAEVPGRGAFRPGAHPRRAPAGAATDHARGAPGTGCQQQARSALCHPTQPPGIHRPAQPRPRACRLRVGIPVRVAARRRS